MYTEISKHGYPLRSGEFWVTVDNNGSIEEMTSNFDGGSFYNLPETVKVLGWERINTDTVDHHDWS